MVSAAINLIGVLPQSYPPSAGLSVNFMTLPFINGDDFGYPEAGLHKKGLSLVRQPINHQFSDSGHDYGMPRMSETT
ncbi:MAG: hypothetical protein ACFB14_00820 [Leptolyngbyaceae cyanobacterium]